MMRLRLVLLIVLAAVAANPCLARNSHPQHGAHAGSTNNGVSGGHPAGANPAPVPATTDAEPTVAPPVLPSHGITQQQIRPINLNVKAVGPGNLPRGQMGTTTVTPPIPRNAIGQSAPAKNFLGAPPAAGLQRRGAVSQPVVHGATAAPPVVSSAARVNLATAINRGGVNGASVIRPVAGSAGIGGPARPAYGISGTAVQNKR